MAIRFRDIILGLALSLILLLLVLAAWGFDSNRDFFSNRPRSMYLIILGAAVFFPVVFRNGAGIRFFQKGQAEIIKHRVTSATLFILSTLLFFISSYSDKCSIWTLGDMACIRYLGLILFVTGSIVSTISIYQRGSNFSSNVTIQQDHRLITRGLYKVIRHPRYLGAIFF